MVFLNALILSFSLELGYMPMGSMALYEMPLYLDYVDISKTYYTDLKADVEFRHFYAGGGVKTGIYGAHSVKRGFFPHAAFYNVAGGYRRGPVDIGVRRICAHPVMPVMRYEEVRKYYDGAYAEMFVKLSGKFGGR